MNHISLAPITKFDGQYRFLSNFYPASIMFQGTRWPTAEHLYQAMKATDLEGRAQFLVNENPAYAKRLGRKITLRPDWNQIKLDVMQEIVKLKFDQNPRLQSMLLDTGNAELIEGNTWGDTFWGVYHGAGANHLGKILMAYRDNLRFRLASKKADQQVILSARKMELIEELNACKTIDELKAFIAQAIIES